MNITNALSPQKYRKELFIEPKIDTVTKLITSMHFP